jgi:hypothetical protein
MTEEDDGEPEYRPEFTSTIPRGEGKSLSSGFPRLHP